MAMVISSFFFHPRLNFCQLILSFDAGAVEKRLYYIYYIYYMIRKKVPNYAPV